MFFKCGFNLKKNHSHHLYFSLIFILHLKYCFCTSEVDFYNSGSSSVSKEEKIRRRNVAEPILRSIQNKERDWIETHHWIYLKENSLLNEMSQQKLSSHDNCMSDSVIPVLKNMDTSLQINKGSSRNIEVMHDSYSTKLHSKINLNSRSDTKKLKEIKGTNSKELTRRHDIVYSFEQHIPGLESGEYHPK